MVSDKRPFFGPHRTWIYAKSGVMRLDDDPVKVYLRELCAVPELTRNEEIELSQHVLAQDEQAESAGKRLIEANLDVVVSIA